LTEEVLTIATARLLSLHLLQFVFHTEPNALQVGADFGIEIDFVEVSCAGHFAQHSGVVERTIQPAECLHRSRNQCLHVSSLGNVNLDEKNLAPGGLDFAFRLLSAFSSSHRDDNAGFGRGK
jgi:hypothetical protein